MSRQTSFMPDERTRTGRLKRSDKRFVKLWYRFPKEKTSLFPGWNLFGRYRDEKTAAEVIRQKEHDWYYGSAEWHIGNERPGE